MSDRDENEAQRRAEWPAWGVSERLILDHGLEFRTTPLEALISRFPGGSQGEDLSSD
jgi:hypothetical protein